MIPPINHIADWRYIRQRKQKQINKGVPCEKTTRIDHNYRVGDKILIKNRSAYRYENLFRCLYKIIQTWTNGTATLRAGEIRHRINIRNIKTYNDADIE